MVNHREREEESQNMQREQQKQKQQASSSGGGEQPSLKEAVSKAKEALEKIKVTEEKNQDKDNKHAASTYKMEQNPEEFQAALAEARGIIENYKYNVQAQAPTQPQTQNASYAIDKIALVGGNPEHVKAALEDAKKELDKLAEQDKSSS